ncbi:hypothetical protein ACWKWN_08630 [Microbacterium trichothecenolyticum]
MSDEITGVPIDEATAADFMMVRAALVKRLGGANEALVWTRIDYRVRAKTPPYVDDDGTSWWPATREDLADETGLSPDQSKRAVQSLIEHGFVIATEHRLGGNYDRTKSYRTVVSDRPLDWADSPNETGRNRPQDRADSPNVPISQTYRKTVEKTSDEVVRLCELLAELVRANGHKVDTVGKTWHQSCDRLMRLDGYSVEQIEWMVRWSTSDEFWSANIRSMPTLREKFSQLVAHAKRDAAKRQRTAPAERAASVVDIGRRLDQTAGRAS